MLGFLEETFAHAGKICLDGLVDNSVADVEFKGPKDLVTIVDKKVEEYIVSRITEKFPDHDIVGEEYGSHLKGSRYRWLIDPIDGTTSYYYRQPYFSISIGLKKDEDYIASGVYAPALNQLFLAEKGKGATLNGDKISVSKCSVLNEAVLATGFACLRSDLEHNNLPYLVRILPEIRDIRRCGSAALDMAYVAAGKYDGFWELNLNSYDIGAGVLLVKEAGGDVCDFHGGGEYPENGIVATNSRITNDILNYLK